ncbi:MAG TPA: J domain-containing protein [Gemmatimonadales bacterium]|jgi:hypothetical protein
MDHLRALRILGIPPGSSADDIKMAWRDLAKVWHPDRFAHDERLQAKAGDNLSRINQAYEALADYDARAIPTMASRMRQSVAIILGMGELGEPPPVLTQPAAPSPPSQPPMVPRAPIGLRHSLRVLGLGSPRETGEVGTRHKAQTPRRLILLLLGLVLILLVYLTR